MFAFVWRPVPVFEMMGKVRRALYSLQLSFLDYIAKTWVLCMQDIEFGCTIVQCARTVLTQTQSNTVILCTCQTFFISFFFHLVCGRFGRRFVCRSKFSGIHCAHCVCIYVNFFSVLFILYKTNKQYGSWWVLITFHAFTQRTMRQTNGKNSF